MKYFNKRLTLRSHEAETLEKSLFSDSLNYFGLQMDGIMSAGGWWWWWVVWSDYRVNLQVQT